MHNESSGAVDQRQRQRRSIRQLHDAVSRDDVTLVRQLTTPTSGSGRLDYDVDQCMRGVTALQAAARRGSVDVCRCLLAAGAEPDRFDPASGDTALHAAAAAGHVDAVRVLLEAGADAEVTDSNGATALGVAAQAGHTEVVSTLLSSGCGLNRGDLNGASPLITSVREGHLDTTSLMTARDDVDLDWTDNERRTALIVAAQLNHRHIVEHLINAGCKLDARDQYGCTAVYFAAKLGHADIVRQLISAGADFNIADTRGWTPLTMAIESLQLDIVKQLINAGADVNTVETDHRSTAVHRVVRYSSRAFSQRDVQLSLFDLLLNHTQCDVNIADNLGWTPLYQAAYNGEIEIVRRLLEKGADVDRVTSFQDTPLHGSITGNKPDITDMLIKAGCNVNRVNFKNKLPLYTAIEKRADNEIVRLLLEAGSETDVCESKSGQSPLFVAVQQQLVDAIQLLINAGCDVNLANSEGNTPLSLACSLGNDVIVELLLQHPAVDVDQGLVRTPLHEAAAVGSTTIIERLIAAGCNVNKLSMTGVSSLFLAADRDHFEVARSLVRHGASPSAAHHIRPPALCCRAHRDAHPHLELEPLFAAVQNDNMAMIKLIVVATPRMPYWTIQTLRDVVFRTGYAQEARLTDRAVTQLAHFFVGALARPRSLLAESRGVIRDALCFGRRHVTVDQAIELLPLPDRLKNYVMLRNESIVGFSDEIK